MKLDRAIKIQTIHNDQDPGFTDAERNEAHQLGIEALKRVNDNPIVPTFHYRALLPGETKD